MLKIGVLFFFIPHLSWGNTSPRFPIALTVIQEVKKVYSTWNKIPDRSLDIVFDESQTSVSAKAEGDHKKITVTIHGGLLNSERITPDGLRMMICHEIGHNLGGAPRKDMPPEWEGSRAPDGLSFSSSEGQADYYASSVCFRRLVDGKDHRSFIDESEVTPRLRKLCQLHHRYQKDQELCIRSALAGKNMLEAVIDFPISFETPDQETAPETLHNEYPSRQCRLDTLLAGALCPRSRPLQLDFNNPTQNSCPTKGMTSRPACWYKS